jgi:hypothetical protein
MGAPPGRYAPHAFLGFSAAPGSCLADFINDRRAARLGSPSFDGRHWLDVRANSDGFYCAHDLPVRDVAKHSRPFVVGVLGGSVAHWFGLQETPRLCTHLSRSRAGSREVAVLNLASAGHKQPQALLALNYFLAAGQRFDALVLLDGFNEAALSHRNWEHGFEPLAPSITHLELADAPVEGYRVPAEARLSERDFVARVVEHWANATRLVHEVCRARSIALVHLLQPNQYHCKKSFSAEERDWAISTTTSYRRAVELVYPELRAAVVELAGSGCTVIDATAAFDHVDDTIFADNCCHYNARGNDILCDIVLDALALDAVSEAETSATDQPHSSAGPAEQTKTDDVYPFW